MTIRAKQRARRRYFRDMNGSGVFDTAFEKYRKGVPTSPLVVSDQVEKLVGPSISKGVPVSAKLSDVFHAGIAEEVTKTRRQAMTHDFESVQRFGKIMRRQR